MKFPITGIDNAAPFFNSWWRALRTNDEGEVDTSIDGQILEDSIAVWMENSKVNQNQANYLNYNFMFKPFQISNNEINRFLSLYDLGTFAPKLYLEKEYTALPYPSLFNSNKSLEYFQSLNSSKNDLKNESLD